MYLFVRGLGVKSLGFWGLVGFRAILAQGFFVSLTLLLTRRERVPWGDAAVRMRLQTTRKPASIAFLQPQEPKI